MTMGVYLITCVANGKKYVGSAVNIERRWNKDHVDCLARHVHHNPILQACHDKYGVDSLRMEVLCVVHNEAWLLSIEQRYLDWIFQFDWRMNIARIAGSPMRGRKHTTEARSKISAGNMGRIPSEETKQKLRKPKGHVAAVAAGLRGKKHTVARVENNRKAQLKRPVVACGTERSLVFESLMAAQRAGFNTKSVQDACKTGRPFKGLIWTYVPV